MGAYKARCIHPHNYLRGLSDKDINKLRGLVLTTLFAYNVPLTMRTLMRHVYVGQVLTFRERRRLSFALARMVENNEIMAERRGPRTNWTYALPALGRRAA